MLFIDVFIKVKIALPIFVLLLDSKHTKNKCAQCVNVGYAQFHQHISMLPPYHHHRCNNKKPHQTNIMAKCELPQDKSIDDETLRSFRVLSVA